MRVLLATIAATVLAALVATAAGAAPTHVAKLTGPEEAWVKPVIRIWNSMNGDLSVVGKQATAADGAALIPGTGQNKTLVTTLADFATCLQALKQAKTPPTARLKPFASTMKAACTFFDTGAHGVAKAIATLNKPNGTKLGTQQLAAAFAQFKKGSTKLGTARRQLLAVGGKNIFGS